jgi:hypothetical protein
MSKLVENIDYVIDKKSGLMILTSYFLSKRGYCCGNNCKNCPYHPKSTKGNKILDDSHKGNFSQESP